MKDSLLGKVALVGVIFFLLGELEYGHSQGEVSDDSRKKEVAEKRFPLRNPFLTKEEEQLFGKKKREVIENLNLSAIFYSPRKESYAIIDGQVVKKDDIIDGKEVIGITPEEVILKDSQGREFSLKLNRLF
ncbi:MAG: hypothetical protein DRP72_01875 [Candidatus Omnitrophota bacterium]|nr:MAG: hypothetical protein DRP72_01875 [Candidatus Omnitrophota bacterium]